VNDLIEKLSDRIVSIRSWAGGEVEVRLRGGETVRGHRDEVRERLAEMLANEVAAKKPKPTPRKVKARASEQKKDSQRPTASKPPVGRKRGKGNPADAGN